MSFLKKFLPNNANRKIFPFFLSFCTAGFGAALGFVASAASFHWLSAVAFFITAFGVLGGFVSILYRWWQFFRRGL